MAMKVHAAGDSAETYGLKTDEQCYIQIHHPNGKWGMVQELDEQGQWGWQHWMSQYDVTEIDTFPDGCDLSEKL